MEGSASFLFLEEMEGQVVKSESVMRRMAEDEKPRERLIKMGCSGLTTVELIAILVSVGTAEADVMQLSQQILDDCGGDLNVLGQRDYEYFKKYKGLGPAKITKLIAALELSRRRQIAQVSKREPMSDSGKLFQLLQPMIGDGQTEQFVIVMMNHRNVLIDTRIVSTGGYAAVMVDVKQCLVTALKSGASAVAFAHNHPAGSLTPSTEDDRLTLRLKKAFEAVEIRVLDHLIVSPDVKSYYSYLDRGRL